MNGERLLIRADSGGSLGLGHAMRCLALAQALRDAGSEVRFLSRALPGSARPVLESAGFAVHDAPEAPEASPLGHGDAEATLTVARAAHATAVLVDHYGADAAYLAGLVAGGLPLAVVDDLADRDLTAADWLLNGGLAAATLAYRTRPSCIRLLGPDYALLRPGLVRARAAVPRTFSPGDRRVLVTLGGGDVLEPAREVLEALEACPRSLEIQVAATAPAPELVRVAQASRHDVRVVSTVGGMVDLMVWADVSINAGGVTALELCVLGVPMLIKAMSRDQEPNVRAFVAGGCAFDAGTGAPDGPLALRLDGLLADAAARREMSSRASALVDGAGAERAARSLCAMSTGRR